MQPAGRKKIRFPGKTSKRDGGLPCWWENNRFLNRKARRLETKKLIRELYD